MIMKKILHLALLALLAFLVPTSTFAQIKLVSKSILLPEPSQGSFYLDGLAYAQNTKTGETLIASYATVEGGGILGRIVRGDTVSKLFTIVSKPRNSIDVFNGGADLQAAYNPITNEYLVLHSEGHEDASGQFGKIVAVRLAANGSRKGKPIDITSKFSDLRLFDNKSRVLRFNPLTRGYVTFSHRHTKPADTTTIGVYEQLTPKGKPAARPALLDWKTVQGVNWPQQEIRWPSDFAFLPSGKMVMYATAAESRVVTEIEYLVATVDASNQKQLINLRPEDWVSVTSATALPPLGIDGGVLVLLAPDTPVFYFRDAKSVKGQRISADGNLLGKSFKALKPPGSKKRLFVTSAAFSETSRGIAGLLIAVDDPGWPNGPVTVWGQKLNSNGDPVGRSKKLFKTANNERLDFSKLFALLPQAGDVEAHFVWYGLKGDNVGNTGILKLDITVS